jgi:hypothetical protein
MAKNIGLIKISGKVGDLQFFKKGGKAYVGLASQISKDRIKKDPAFKRTRENMAEFGGAAAVSKAIRQQLIPLRGLFEVGLHARMTSLVRLLINLGTGERGQRAVEFSQNKEELAGIELNKLSHISEILFTPLEVTVNADRNQMVLNIAEFLPSDYMNIPEGASHFRIHAAALALSDFAPGGVKNRYRPINSTQHGLFAVQTTAETSVMSTVTGGLSLTVDLPGAPTLDADVSLATFIGIEFLQNINGTYYQLASNNAIRIQELF